MIAIMDHDTTWAIRTLLPLLTLIAVSTADAQQPGRDSVMASSPAGPSRQPPMRPWVVELRTSSVFDSNLDRNEESLDTYGFVAGARAQYRHNFTQDELTVEYEAALHRYTQTDRWDRLSHKLRALVERRLAERWATGVAGEVTLKGSSEDRTVGDQFLVEPRLEYDLDEDTRARVYGALRLRQYDHEPDQNALNRYLGIEFTQEADGDREWEVGLRYEVNAADSSRRYYRRWTWHTKHVTPLSDRDELELELKLRTRIFPERLVEAEDVDVPRRDQRWIPAALWVRELNGRMTLQMQYEYETRSSNDPEEGYRGHQVRMSLFTRLW